MDVKKFKMPKSVSADINNSGKNKKDDPKKSKVGTITITLSNYLVNKGISDEVFKKKD